MLVSLLSRCLSPVWWDGAAQQPEQLCSNYKSSSRGGQWVSAVMFVQKVLMQNVWRNLICCVVGLIRWRGTIPARASRSQPKESSSGCCHRKQLALLSPYICHGVEGAILIQIINKMFIFLSLFSILPLFWGAVSVWIYLSLRRVTWLRNIISPRVWNKPVCSLWFFCFCITLRVLCSPNIIDNSFVLTRHYLQVN